MSHAQDEVHLRSAIAAARQASARGDMPFGAVLVKDGQTLLTALNNQVTTSDCTGHAEVVLIREAAAQLGPDALRGATVYASGEPCAMCSGAMFWAGITRVVFGATTPDIGAALGGPSLGARCADVLASGSPLVEVLGPLLREEAVAALAPHA
ncbi:nucleoside deaminase [Ideonella azotifigens]|uniref:Nucleoside deaminase n=1 Tax=Ideonella azotifigens TaxID=513160 RepID=A0ABP3VC84_9BURK|nr:nucleoside deaminase [Ideonella azotifigens]MCD2344617.1 nucleoside deaminase [Ideonella azotifigens]